MTHIDDSMGKMHSLNRKRLQLDNLVGFSCLEMTQNGQNAQNMPKMYISETKKGRYFLRTKS